MTRAEIIERFRQENPEITIRVLADSVLNSWCEIGNLEICTRANLITKETTFSAIADQSTYDLTSEISKFYDISEYPGGGVNYNGKRLTKRAKSEMSALHTGWRSSSSGTPTEYFRDEKNIVLWRPPSGTEDIIVDAVLLADPFDDDAKTPYNELSYLEPFHYAIVKYLTWRAKSKVGKPQDASTASLEYVAFIDWMKKEIGSGENNIINFTPRSRR